MKVSSIIDERFVSLHAVILCSSASKPKSGDDEALQARHARSDVFDRKRPDRGSVQLHLAMPVSGNCECCLCLILQLCGPLNINRTE